MRILQINAVNAIGSTGRTSSELATGLRERGHQVLTLHADGPQTMDSVRVGGRLDTKAHALLARTTGLQGYWSSGVTRRVLSLLDEFQPDVVRIGNVHANFLHLPMLLQYLAHRDIATVVTLDDCWFFTGKCTHYSEVGCSRWMTGCHHCPQLSRDIPSWWLDRTSRMWTDKSALLAAIPRLAVVGVSDWMTSEARKSFLGGASLLKRIYNWVDLERFCPRQTTLREEYGWGEDAMILAVASGWSPVKGLDDALRFAAMLPQNMRMVMVGDVPRRTLFPERVDHFTTIADVTRLAEFYAVADVFVNFSRQESFGKVSAEALASGTPVVTNRFTANPELVGPECGLVVSDPTPKNILQAVQSVAASGRDAYRKTCRDFAVSNFGLERGISEYESLFQSMVVD